VRRSRDLQALEEELSDRIGTTVTIKAGRDGSGQLCLRYSNLEHLDALLDKLRD